MLIGLVGLRGHYGSDKPCQRASRADSLGKPIFAEKPMVTMVGDVEELAVLKPYANRGPEPQQTYWRNVVGNAELVERDLREQVLLERIQHDMGLPSLREGIVFASGALKHDLGRRLQSVPVGRSILEKRTALSRAELRKVRGL